MFTYKHLITLKTKEEIGLFGPDYFEDKRNFWAAHQKMLNMLYDKVIETGFPMRILEVDSNESITIDGVYSFKEWLRNNQPFQF